MGKKHKSGKNGGPSLRTRLEMIERKIPEFPHKVVTKLDSKTAPISPDTVEHATYGHFCEVPLKEYGKQVWLFMDAAGAAAFRKKHRELVIG